MRTVWALCAAPLFLMGCAKILGGSGSSGAGDGPDGPYSLALRLESAWENDSANKTPEVVCTVPQGSPEGDYPCSHAMPEGKLFYSKLFFTVEGYLPCELVVFQPYFYLASSTAGFQPLWSSGTHDCSNPAALPKECFNGVAPQLIESFPQFTGVYILMSQQNSHTFEVQSANTLSAGRTTNRYTCNSLDAASRGLNLGGVAGDGYVANSMVDYRVECRDRWLQPIYSISFTLTDDDDKTGNPDPDDGDSNHRADWNSALDPL